MIFKDHVVAGVDVGSTRKGFHAVALLGGNYLDHIASCNVEVIVAWCIKLDAQAIGIDAPCCWSHDGHARTAERELMANRIRCFATPTLERARAHPREYFGWMMNGARLYAALAPHFDLFNGRNVKRPVCFETFPHAITCQLAREIVRNRDKMHRRRELLEAAGIATQRLANVDLRDAALCALTAHALLRGQFCKYGHERDGFIVVPKE